jgi:hypothetical protein
VLFTSPVVRASDVWTYGLYTVGLYGLDLVHRSLSVVIIDLVFSVRWPASENLRASASSVFYSRLYPHLRKFTGLIYTATTSMKSLFYIATPSHQSHQDATAESSQEGQQDTGRALCDDKPSSHMAIDQNWLRSQCIVSLCSIGATVLLLPLQSYMLRRVAHYYAPMLTSSIPLLVPVSVSPWAGQAHFTPWASKLGLSLAAQFFIGAYVGMDLSY